MHFHVQHAYEASATRVRAMLTDAGFLDAMMSAAPVSAHQVNVDGPHTVVEADAPAPAQAARFTGASLHVTLDVDWGQAAPDGSCHGPVTVAVAKLPARLEGVASVTPAGETASTVTYDGEFSIHIPLVGGKLEAAAAPYITRVLDAQQAAGRTWLAGHPA